MNFIPTFPPYIYTNNTKALIVEHSLDRLASWPWNVPNPMVEGKGGRGKGEIDRIGALRLRDLNSIKLPM